MGNEKLNKINVLHLRSSGGYFGAEAVILSLTKGLNDKYFDNYISCFKNRNNSQTEFIKQANKEGIKTLILNGENKGIFNDIQKLITLLKANNIKILCTHGYKEDIIGFFAAKVTGIKKVAMVHGWTGHTFRVKIYEILDKFILRFFDRIIIVTESLKSKLLKMGISESKIITIHNAIDLDKYSYNTDGEKVKTEFNIDASEKIVGTIGRLSKEKGYKYLLKTAKEVVRQYPNVKFIIVGEGSERENLVKMSKELRIQDKVIFTGYRKDIELFFSAFNVFVLPSLTEGLPNVILEALAFRKPVVATNVGGVGELVRHKETGWLTESANINGLFEGISFCLMNQTEAQQMARNGHKLIKERFTVEQRVTKMEDLYREILGIKQKETNEKN